MPVIFLRIFERYGLPRSTAAWSVKAFDLPHHGLQEKMVRSGMPELVVLFLFHRSERSARPDLSRMFAELVGMVRDELQAMYDGLFPADAAAYCPMCGGAVHTPGDIASGRSRYGEDGRCWWCSKWVRPVGWSQVRHLV